jgi:hypothetical protein
MENHRGWEIFEAHPLKNERTEISKILQGEIAAMEIMTYMLH